MALKEVKFIAPIGKVYQLVYAILDTHTFLSTEGWLEINNLPEIHKLTEKEIDEILKTFKKVETQALLKRKSVV